MERPEFISLPVRGRVIRLRPTAITRLEVDFNGRAVVYLCDGGVMTASLTVAEVEAVCAGEQVAAAAPKRTRKPA